MLVSFHPRLVVQEPIHEELLIGQCLISLVTFIKTSGTDVNFSHFFNLTQLGSIFSIHNEKLYILHPLPSWYDVFQLVQVAGILRPAWYFTVAHCSLRLGCTIHADYVGFDRAFLQTPEISHYEDITDKESPYPEMGISLPRYRRESGHSRRQMRDCRLVLTHLFCKLLMLNCCEPAAFRCQPQQGVTARPSKARDRQIVLEGGCRQQTGAGIRTI